MRLLRRNYNADDITVSFDTMRCIHARECVMGLPAVFDRMKKPWIQPEHAEADRIAAVVLRCPSGALQFERHDGGAPESPAPVNTITIGQNGPFYARGDLEIVGQPGAEPLREMRAALCRCGASANRPFCDESHLKVGFDHPVALEAAAPDADARRLRISMQPDGSLRCEGPFELRDAAGHVIERSGGA